MFPVAIRGSTRRRALTFRSHWLHVQRGQSSLLLGAANLPLRAVKVLNAKGMIAYSDLTAKIASLAVAPDSEALRELLGDISEGTRTHAGDAR
jgi:hypothetical protein